MGHFHHGDHEDGDRNPRTGTEIPGRGGGERDLISNSTPAATTRMTSASRSVCSDVSHLNVSALIVQGKVIHSFEEKLVSQMGEWKRSVRVGPSAYEPSGLPLTRLAHRDGSLSDRVYVSFTKSGTEPDDIELFC